MTTLRRTAPPASIIPAGAAVGVALAMVAAAVVAGAGVGYLAMHLPWAGMLEFFYAHVYMLPLVLLGAIAAFGVGLATHLFAKESTRRPGLISLAGAACALLLECGIYLLFLR